MARKVLIQIRRGLEANIGTLAPGELGYCTDTKKLYIGTDTGNVLLLAAQSVGDMLKSIYDVDNDGKVDAAEAADSADTLDGKHASDLVAQFTLPPSGGAIKYYKIAELVTAVGLGENGGIFYINGTGDYGSNQMGLDILQFSTRNTPFLRILRLLNYGGGTVQYGYVVNNSTGKTEIWIQVAAYNYGITVYMGNNRALTAFGNLLSQTTAPSGIVWVTPTEILTNKKGVTWNQLKGV